MCPHVLCLSLSAPPPSLLSPNKCPFTTFFLFSFLSFCDSNIIFLVSARFTVLDPKKLFHFLLAFFCHFCLNSLTPDQNLLSTSMKTSNSSALLKQEFFKKWIKGLQIYSSFNKEMTVFERKKAIKLSADVAIASTRNAATHWSKALATSAAADGAARIVVEQILGRKIAEKKAGMMTCSKKIVRRSRAARGRKAAASRVVRCASSTARKLVRNRTRVLKRLVPGGKQLDEFSLIKETLDYIASLQVQVDVMRHLAAAAEMLDHQQRSS